MTEPWRASAEVGTDDPLVPALRRAMNDLASDVRVNGLTERVHRRAAGQRRRRRAAATVGATALAAALGGGVLFATRMPPFGPGEGDAVQLVSPAAATTPATTPATGPATASASGTAPRPSTPGRTTEARNTGPTPSRTGSPAGAATIGDSGSGVGSGSGPGGGWGPGWAEEFDQQPAPGDRWYTYPTGGGYPWAQYTSADAQVVGGVLQLTARRSTDGATTAIAGAAARPTSSLNRYGRWEVRWRLSSPPGVTGTLVMLDPNGNAALSAGLSPGGTLTLVDRLDGTRQSVPLDVTQYHRVALEWRPDSIRWLVDGLQVASWQQGLPSVGLRPAVQTDVAAGCGPGATGSGCLPPGGTARLDVDRVTFSAAG